MIEFNEKVKRSLLEILSNEEKEALPVAKSIMDRFSGYYINQIEKSSTNTEMADLFRSISALLFSMNEMR